MDKSKAFEQSSSTCTAFRHRPQIVKQTNKASLHVGENVSPRTPVKLFRQTYLLALVILYSCVSVTAWTIICVQNRKPINYPTYDLVYNAYWSVRFARRMRENADWLRVMRIVLSITNTLVIPLTSTVCASAAIIYVRHFGCRSTLSMQHVSVLADRGWTSPWMWRALLSNSGWSSFGSSFLIFAIVFHALGKSSA